ncbi:hypothetical protein [Thalassospira profundimaris]|uniref:hypothetical protein n=1 Tax=Thalassospira profundimaris TaxID=502049 RepID=UPI00028735FC|nr:hypothetical protein [Thalassospira profundimaris]EKF06310.1 hypothetical protein TH2_20121 [Thalassospira profundimaris WP0211]
MSVYSPDQISELEQASYAVQGKYENLLLAYYSKKYRTANGYEHALHGFGRRLRVMTRCIENTFRVLPPSQTAKPDDNQRLDATINIQSFVQNAYGCCENLAWIWVHERDIKMPSGDPVSHGAVGFRKTNRVVWRSLPTDFREYLQTLDKWFENLKGFRDGLAHRVPLYIPPSLVDPANTGKYKELERQTRIAEFTQNHEKLRRVEEELAQIEFFRPVMTHSVTEESPLIRFHDQLLTDFNTVEEIATKFHKIL